jgi:hypothetical protein
MLSISVGARTRPVNPIEPMEAVAALAVTVTVKDTAARAETKRVAVISNSPQVACVPLGILSNSAACIESASDYLSR